MGFWHRGPPKQSSTLEPVAEVHVVPTSDMLNDPYSVGTMLQVSGWDMAAGAWMWLHDANTVADAGGDAPGLYMHTDAQIPVGAAQQVSDPFVMVPNSVTMQPAAIRTSELQAHFDAYLRSVQDHLLGAP